MNKEEISLKNLNKEGFIFENLLGAPITFYIQTMSGEKSPKENYEKYVIETDKPLFVEKLELEMMRREKAKYQFGQSLKLISEDMLRIMVEINNWEFAPDIPIELGGCHSFAFKHKKTKNKKDYKDYTFPAICKVNSNVTIAYNI